MTMFDMIRVNGILKPGLDGLLSSKKPLLQVRYGEQFLFRFSAVICHAYFLNLF
jgi:hypothetical protein